MIKVGLTGGIGSGKSTVAKVFEVLGIPVYYADDAAKRLMNDDNNLKQKIKDLFGPSVYKDNLLDKKYLSAIVFNNPQKLQLLNAVVHPATINDASVWLQQQTTPYAIKEAALIFESGAQKDLDYIIGVQAPTALRLQRTMQREGITREEVLARMDKQLDEIIKMRLCDFVIKNDEQELVIMQVLELHQNLLKQAEN